MKSSPLVRMVMGVSQRIELGKRKENSRINHLNPRGFLDYSKALSPNCLGKKNTDFTVLYGTYTQAFSPAVLQLTEKLRWVVLCKSSTA